MESVFVSAVIIINNVTTLAGQQRRMSSEVVHSYGSSQLLELQDDALPSLQLLLCNAPAETTCSHFSHLRVCKQQAQLLQVRGACQ